MVLRHFTSFVPLLLLIAALLRVDFFFTIIYFLVAVLALSQLWLKRATEHLGVERSLADRAFTGDRVTVELVVRNTGWLPVPWLEVSERLPVALQAVPFQRQVVSLGPHEERRFRYTLNCRRRGYYT